MNAPKPHFDRPRKPLQAAMRYLAQAVLYGAFMAVIGYFSSAPGYRHLADDQAVIKLSLSHAGQRIGECRKLTAEEMAELPPNMRVPEICPRERSPVTLELLLDGERLYHANIAPSGLNRDGAATAYRRIAVPAGKHTLLARLNDSVHVEGFNYERSRELHLAPAQVLVVDFKALTGGFEFR